MTAPRPIALGAGCTLALLLAAHPARSVCPTSRGFVSFDATVASYVYTPGLCEVGPVCDPPDATSVTSDFTGAFWRSGYGDPAPGGSAGIDNGTYPARDGHDGGWVRSAPGYAAWIQGDWADDARIDGCIDGPPGTPRCMAILLADQRESTGYFALLTRDREDPQPLYSFLKPDGEPIRLDEVPRPVLTGAASDPDGITVHVAAESISDTALDLQEPGCADGLVAGFRVHVRRLAPGESSSPDRSLATWSLADGGAGPGGEPWPLGAEASVRIGPPTCLSTVLALSLVFESGFETPYVSADSVRIDLDPYCTDHDCDGWCGFAEAPEIPLDCDDEDPDVYPGAPQLCDGRNNDCDHPSWPELAGTNEDPERGDLDDDGVVDPCDLDDGLIWLQAPAPGRIEWQPEPDPGPWNVYRGDLAALFATGVYTQTAGEDPLAGRACGLVSPSWDDAVLPAVSEAAFYLVTGAPPSGEWSPGSDSDGNPRPNDAPCP